jgi:hypothetical protein
MRRVLQLVPTQGAFVITGLAEMTSSRGRERELLSASRRDDHSIFINLPVCLVSAFLRFQITSHMLGWEVKQGLEM